jgi:hypothetical protein
MIGSRPIDRPLQIGHTGLRVAARNVEVFVSENLGDLGQLCAGVE